MSEAEQAGRERLPPPVLAGGSEVKDRGEDTDIVITIRIGYYNAATHKFVVLTEDGFNKTKLKIICRDSNQNAVYPKNPINIDDYVAALNDQWGSDTDIHYTVELEADPANRPMSESDVDTTLVIKTQEHVDGAWVDKSLDKVSWELETEFIRNLTDPDG